MHARPRPSPWLLGACALLALALLATGCGGDDDATTDDTAADPTPTQDLGQKPEVEVPEGDPPTELVVEDLVVGEGDEAAAGSTVEVHYVGVAWTTGEQFDASWDRGRTFSFQLGAGDVIPGWDEGVEGMHEGGRRHLVIPPGMAYGERGVPPDIGPDETLVFVVDLLSVS